MSMRVLIGSLLAAMAVAGADAGAGQFVEIDSGAKAEPVRLIGYLARPPGAGPFSAVVLLHGCGGFHSSMISWADRLSRYGYAALAIDSFGPRGMDDHCDDWTPPSSCEAMAAGRSELGAPRTPGERSSIELVVYPGVHHSFDQLDLSLAPTRGITIKGHRAEFNDEATRNSIVRVRDFLQRTIGGQ